MIERVISGGQSGADIAGWKAARAVGLATSGWLPSGFLTEDGPRPEYADLYGAREMATADYPTRTKANVQDADALIWFGNPYSPGGKLTIACATDKFIDHMIVVNGRTVQPGRVAEWITGETADPIGTLMIAGNRESKAPGIGRWVEAYLLEVFALLGFHPIEGQET